jgi:valacyclovir hydrolase
MRTPYVSLYGDKYFRKMMNDWIDGMKRIYEHTGGDICKNYLPKIKCPTLIVHGLKDIMVFGEHPSYLKANISNSR